MDGVAAADFEEIAHSGGTVTFKLVTLNGRKAYQVSWQNSRPNASGIIGVYALPQGIAVSSLPLGGMGQPIPAPQIPGCYSVFIGSDSEGRFGHECPACRQYWRSQGWAAICPYCRLDGDGIQFLTKAQKAYIQQYCERLNAALAEGVDGEHVIDMDVVADAAGKEVEKPPFYYAEVSQQNKFTCDACGVFNDILGRFSYCCSCGTRNDFQELKSKIIPAIRDRINSGGPYEGCVKDAVAAFDSFAGKLVEQLRQLVPMTTRRRNVLENLGFHNLKKVATEIRAVFDIDILDGIEADEQQFATLMFHRRHVYEHQGGEADEKYISDSGDKTVRPKQALHETQESAHRLANVVLKMAGNLHRGFHDIIPPERAVIEAAERRHSGELPGMKKI